MSLQTLMTTHPVVLETGCLAVLVMLMNETLLTQATPILKAKWMTDGRGWEAGWEITLTAPPPPPHPTCHQPIVVCVVLSQ